MNDPVSRAALACVYERAVHIAELFQEHQRFVRLHESLFQAEAGEGIKAALRDTIDIQFEQLFEDIMFALDHDVSKGAITPLEQVLPEELRCRFPRFA